MEAMQAAILLMPDPNREALQTLLLFLNEVAANSETNQVRCVIFVWENQSQSEDKITACQAYYATYIGATLIRSSIIFVTQRYYIQFSKKY